MGKAPIALGWVLVCGVACGGRLEGGVEPSEEVGGAGGSGGAESASEPSTQPSTGPAYRDPQPLGICEGGFAPEAESDERPCVYEVDERCYSTVSAACACACPRDRESTCFTGMPTELPGSPAFVSCS